MQANDYIPFDIQRTESPMGHSFKHGASPLREASSPVFTHQTVKSLSLSVEHHPSLIIKSPPLLATEPQSPVEIQDPLDPFATQPPSFFDSGSTVAAFASSVMPLPPHLASGLFGATGLDSSSATIQLPHLPSSTNSLNYCSGPLSHPIGGRECPPSEAMFSGSNPFVNCRDATTTHMSTGTSHPSSINLPISPLLSQTGSNQRSAPCPIRCMGTPTMITNSVPLSLSQTDSIQHSVPCPIRSMATPSMTRMQASSFVPLPCIPSQSQFDSNLGSVSQISGPLASHGVPPQSFLQQFAQATNYDKLAEAQAQEDVEPPRFSSPFRATRPSHTSAPFTNSGVTELPRRQQPPITAAIEYTTFQGQFHGRTDSATSMSSASSTSSVIVVDHGTVLSAKLPLIGHPQATVPTTFQRPLVHAVTTMQIPSPLRPSPLHLPASSWQVPSCRPALSAEAGWRAPLSSRPIVAPRPPHATHASVYPNGALASAGMRFVQHPVTTMSFLNRQTSLPPSPLVPGVGSKVAEAHAYQPSAMTGSPQMRASPTFGMRPRTSLIPPLNLNSPIVSPVKHRSPTMTTRSNRDEAVLHVRKGALSATSPNVELKLERPRSGASTDRGRSASFWRTCTHSFWPFSPQDLSAEARSKRR
ncbi:MAG: uncharacterized protein KVP18_001839 [Porospora cf. gigantea A]|uniref:uncharacterized protein n=1 Tax=Porospora cf. gigantea A TaxID=2853593 RepID=UPI003559AC5B|nr:MAG: hypothetical protein KVP18_001839 [Porospora cf. gigantea A]